jgi:hypothetical protein
MGSIPGKPADHRRPIGAPPGDHAASDRQFVIFSQHTAASKSFGFGVIIVVTAYRLIYGFGQVVPAGGMFPWNHLLVESLCMSARHSSGETGVPK